MSKKATSANKKKQPSPVKSSPPPGSFFRNFREIVESIAIAFVLAFLFRTFEAEAFVIPTGSMAPTLQGRHKDIHCPECSFRYRTGASSEENENIQNLRSQLASGMVLNQNNQWVPMKQMMRDQKKREINGQRVIAATCPNCRFTDTVAGITAGNLNLKEPLEWQETPKEKSYNGDRILVSKFAYEFSEPKRWDVFVFKFPGDANQNYIKRLIGLPGETLRLFGGDIFIKNRQGGVGKHDLETFTIERKPPKKILSMMQTVHDNAHDPATLFNAGWPLRWTAEGQDASGWQVATTTEGKTVSQVYSVDGKSETTSWLRYQNTFPDMSDWVAAQKAAKNKTKAWTDNNKNSIKPKLITDFYAYNTNIILGQVKNDRFRTLRMQNFRLGLHWVGDLVLEADVEIQRGEGDILLDLVEGGKHFRCTIDTKTGRATLSIPGHPDFAPSAPTKVRSSGTYAIRFANVDDQLALWVDDTLIDFGGETGTAEYDSAAVFGAEKGPLPQSTIADAGDLSPVGIGSRGVSLSIKHLRVLRDIYYISDKVGGSPAITGMTIHSRPFENLDDQEIHRNGMMEYLTNPNYWSILKQRRTVDFPLIKDKAKPERDQFFAMGDNSPSSLDSRLWFKDGQAKNVDEMPGGRFVERRLLIGKAVFVFWPHSWGKIPGLGIPFPYFPSFSDMRIIR